MSDSKFMPKRSRWPSRAYSPIERRRKILLSRMRRFSYGSISITLVLIATLSAFGLTDLVTYLVAIWIIALIVLGLAGALLWKFARAGKFSGLLPKSPDGGSIRIPVVVLAAIAGILGVSGSFLAAGQLLASGYVVISAVLCVMILFMPERT